jgi:hypothetical protein
LFFREYVPCNLPRFFKQALCKLNIDALLPLLGLSVNHFNIPARVRPLVWLRFGVQNPRRVTSLKREAVVLIIVDVIA